MNKILFSTQSFLDRFKRLYRFQTNFQLAQLMRVFIRRFHLNLFHRYIGIGSLIVPFERNSITSSPSVASLARHISRSKRPNTSSPPLPKKSNERRKNGRHRTISRRKVIMSDTRQYPPLPIGQKFTCRGN